MSLIAAYIVPHPPLAVPAVGRGEERAIQATINGYQEVARRIAEQAPDTIVLISPHTAYFGDWIYIAGGSGAEGDLSQFRAPEVHLSVKYDTAFRDALVRAADSRGIPAGPIGDEVKRLDHGMMVPLYYLDQAYPSSCYQLVSVGGSALPPTCLEEFGRCITLAADALDRRCVLLISGDLSHKLKEEGPYGFHPAAPQFDQAFVDIVRSGDLAQFAVLDKRMCEDAAECGLSGFVMMEGALDELRDETGDEVTSELVSYEGPFGVGYGVAAFEAHPAESASAQAQPERYSEDVLVDLAYRTVNQYVSEGTVPAAPELPAGVPARAGCFVSIHMRDTDDLRGCIGTIQPTCATLAEEVIQNAISASTRDPRFQPIVPDELPNLSINVDVLFPPEPATVEGLDVKRYGVIVTQGGRRGLLLPDLEGVDTVEQQLAIACAKAGIPQFGPDVELERFEVVRHT